MTENKINSDERFVRWQAVLREHLTFLNNLIIALSVGTMGFCLKLLSEKDFYPNCCQKIFFTSGLIFMFISLAAGLSTAISRLSDFRATVKKIKNELTGNFSEHELLKRLMDVYKQTTWGLFYSQLIFFCLSVLSLTISFLMIYKDKLF